MPKTYLKTQGITTRCQTYRLVQQLLRFSPKMLVLLIMLFIFGNKNTSSYAYSHIQQIYAMVFISI